jgi:N-glycosylase/DNA lyase
LKGSSITAKRRRAPRPIEATTSDEVAIPVKEFNLQRTIESGQAFHWVPVNGGYAGCIGRTPCWITQRGTSVRVNAAAANSARDYFALDHDMRQIYRSFPDDTVMRAALEFSRGTRILRQPLWECLAAFITSALKQVAHIAAISHTLRSRYGETFETEWGAVSAYPAPDRIATLTERELRNCALGFRARSLLGSAEAIAGGRIDLEALRLRESDEIRAELQKLPGVGPKIANCVLLFGYGRLDAFPIDVWIERVLRLAYFADKPEANAVELREFSATYFGPYGGYAQQYLFHHARLTRGRSLEP